MWTFTRRQWATFLIMGLADFCNAICVSLQAPFFPLEVSDRPDARPCHCVINIDSIFFKFMMSYPECFNAKNLASV